MAEKKGLKEFMENLAKDNNLAEKFKDVIEPEEVVKRAKKEGYEFTAQEYEDLLMEHVSGGKFSFDDIEKIFKKAEDLVPKYYVKAKNIVNSIADVAKDIYNNIKNK